MRRPDKLRGLGEDSASPVSNDEVGRLAYYGIASDSGSGIRGGALHPESQITDAA